MIDAVVTRFGLARMPFGRDLPPSVDAHLKFPSPAH